MRVLALSPGTVQQQLERLPALASLAEQLDATLQVACPARSRQVWSLLPAVDKVIPFEFEAGSTLADWANLLGSVREPDFQLSLNFAEGRQVNLMLSMSHIPTRVATSGFSATTTARPGEGWLAQRQEGFLQAIGLSLNAERFRLSLPAKALEEARSRQPAGDGPLLLLAASGISSDWPPEQWQQLPETIRSKLASLRTVVLPPDGSVTSRAAQVASADVVLSSCPITQLLAVYSGVPLVALGADADQLPSREGLRVVQAPAGGLTNLTPQDVLNALGF
jgi:ADP-heptose:LPS heptosyltransferase